MNHNFIVTKKAERPAKPNSGKCFYCNQPIGSCHKDDCVLIQRKVKIRVSIEYEIEVPNYWDKERIEYRRNLGTWCGDNVIDEIVELSEKNNCLCGILKTEYLEDVPDSTVLDE